MVPNYFKILFRNNKQFTLINVVGLVIGITSTLLIMKFVRYETTYDLQSPHADNIWRVYNQTLNGKTVTTEDANTHSAIGPTLKAEVTEVVDYARLYCGNTPEVVVLADKKPFDIQKYYATDQGFFRMFPQKVLFGNGENCLKEPHTAIISRSNAKRIFGTENALNKQITISNGMMRGNYTITAVVEDVPQNTHLKFDMLVSYATKYANGHVDNFESYWDYTYLQLAEGSSTINVKKKLEAINEQFLKKESIRLDVQPFKDIHLHSNLTYELEPNGQIRIVRFLSILALIILVISFINYVNLTTALASERSKEVGIKKTLGASRLKLITQFLFESLSLGLLAFLVSVFLVWIFIGQFSSFIGISLNNHNTKIDLPFWVSSFIFLVFTALIAGLYPALYLSGISPADSLRKKVFFNNSVNLRKSLVVFQFASTAIMIVGVLVVIFQMKFLKNHDLGVKLDQILTIKSIPSESRADSLANRKLTVFRDECSKLSGVSKSASSSIVPGLGINTISGSSRPIHWDKKPDFANITSYFVETDEAFFDLFNIELLAGKHQFFPDPVARFQTVTINETMLKALGFPSADEAIGQQIAYKNSENGAKMTVGAVIKDFHIESLKIAPRPTLYYCFSPEQLGFLSIKIQSSQIEKSVKEIEEIWKKVYPDQPFNYWFLDENFAHQYKAEVQFGKVFGFFASIAIFLSSLGLLGLVLYSSKRRNKEIGIRKVLGASVKSIVVLLSKEYLILMSIAILIASPIAYFLMNKWLDGFAYKISIAWWFYALAGLFVLLIALSSVGFQSIRAAISNPVKSLKVE
jgi:putative ABC transport system permease protein